MSFPVPPGAAAFAAAGQAAYDAAASAGQDWRKRLREAAYTSPKGTRIRFQFTDVGREFDKRGTAFDYPGVRNSYVQQMGHSSRRYPLRVYFSGANHDLEATAFELALLEDGLGKLEHPLYGTIDVVPFGTITRRDDLASAANQSVIEVTFWTTLGAVYPSAGADSTDEIAAAIGTFDVAVSQQFAASVDFRALGKQASGVATTRQFLRDVSATLRSVSDQVSSVRGQFQDGVDGVNLGLDILIGQPLLLAQQISNLVQAPARAAAGIGSRLEAYAALATRIIASHAGNPAEGLAGGATLPRRSSRVANDFAISNLFALNAMAGAVVAVSAEATDETGTTAAIPFTTRPQAIDAADAIAAQMAEIVAWRDGGYDALGEVPGQLDTGEGYQALERAVALAQGYLVQLSFALLPERQIVLDRDRTIIDLAAEIYGSVDDRLDLLIESNNLTGDQILELRAGTTIKYYPTQQGA